MSRPALGWPWVVVGSLLVAALSLLPVDAAPTYDPWAWIIWGREITQLDLNTVDGPSWKPLPVLFTTAFAPFGEAAPALWLVIARAGALLAAVLAFRVARRLGGPVAGTTAAAAVLLAPWTLRNAGLGNSEPLMFAFVLGAIDRHLAGHHRAAFAFGVLAGLLRPECWPFLLAYGLWLLWRERRAALPAAALGFGCLPVLWLGPELWGSGNLLRAAERARNPRADSAAFADNPVIQVLGDAADLVPVAAWAGLAVAAALVVSGRVRGPRARTAGVLVVVALLWLGLVALMTKDGFSGNPRYLVTPVVLLIVVAAAGTGWLVEQLRVVGGTALGAAAATAAAAAFVLPWTGQIDRSLKELAYQGALPHRLAEAVERAGGPDRILACGGPSTGAFLVPAVAWRLGVHANDVSMTARAPGVVFRVRTNRGGGADPSLRPVAGEPARTLATAPHWRLLAVGCGA